MAVKGVQGNMAAQSRIMGHDAVAIVAEAINLTDVTSLITVNPTGITVDGIYPGLTATPVLGGGSGAIFTAVVTGGTVTKLTTTTSGTGYSTGDSVAIAAALLPGASSDLRMTLSSSATQIPGTDTRGVALYVGSGAQDITVTMESGTSTIFKGVAAGTFMPILVTHLTVGVDVIAIY